MAEETSTNDAPQDPPQEPQVPENTPGGPEDVAKLFNPEAPADPPQGGGDGTPADPPEEYVVGRVPKQFYREDGKHDIEGLVKSWFDTKKDRDGLAAQVKQAQADAGDMPTFEAYNAEIDWDAIRKSAPNAWLLPEGEENKAATALVQRLHQQGVPVAKAKAAVASYWQDLNAMTPARKSADELRQAAVAHLGPNGAAMMDEVKNGLASRASKRAWTEGEMAEIRGLLLSGPGTSLLHQLLRTGGSAAPPNTTSTAPVQTVEQERAALLKKMNEQPFHEIRDEVMANAERLGLFENAA